MTIVALTPTNLVGVALAGALAYVAYALFLHPLRKTPGPFLARISVIPNYIHAKRGDRQYWLDSLHKQYGSVVRYTPDALSFNTRSAFNQIYGSHKHNAIKGDFYDIIRHSAGGYESTLTARDPARHAVKRRLLSHVFSEQALKDYRPGIAKIVRQWGDAIQKEAAANNGNLNLGQWIDYLVFDTLSEIAFRKQFGLIRGENRFMQTLLPEVTKMWTTTYYHPASKFLQWLYWDTPAGKLLGGKTYEDNVKFRQFAFKALSERRKMNIDTENGDPADFFTYVLTARDPETGATYSEGDLLCESVLFIIAGSHTTATTMAAVMHYLVNNPDKLAKVQAEVRGAFSSEEEVATSTDSELQNFHYLRACIDESLRLSTPNPAPLPRVVVKGMTIDGEFYPPGTSVGINTYSTQRSPDFCPNSELFIPERWIKDSPQYDGTSHIAFSGGPTGCIGRALAYMQMRVVLSTLLFRFDLSVDNPAGARTDYRLHDAFIGKGDGPHIKLRPAAVAQ